MPCKAVLESYGKEALVSFDGVKRKVNSEFIEVKKGDKIMVFNNFIIEKI